MDVFPPRISYNRSKSCSSTFPPGGGAVVPDYYTTQTENHRGWESSGMLLLPRCPNSPVGTVGGRARPVSQAVSNKSVLRLAARLRPSRQPQFPWTPQWKNKVPSVLTVLGRRYDNPVNLSLTSHSFLATASSRPGAPTCCSAQLEK